MSRILIVDDHQVVIEGVKSLLTGLPEFQLAGECSESLQAMDRVKILAPDIVIMDISMPDLNGIEITRQIRSFNPEIRIIIYTMFSDKEFLIDLFKEGICGYVLKDDPLQDLILALKAVQGGGTYFSTKAPTILITHMEELERQINHVDSLDILSRREHEIFLLLAEGKNIRKIAESLYISPKTVETHKYHIMEKLNVSSLVELTKLAIRKNLINY